MTSTSASPAEQIDGFAGELVGPAHAAYDGLRTVYNAMIDRRPALIARCRGVADVRAAVLHGRRHDMAISVYGGGHSVTGHATCDGGLMIDLRPMRGIQVDPGSAVARAQAGVTWGELDRETQQFGLAVTGGRVTTTGIAGFTLGGGSGWLERRLGLAIDNLRSVDVVTADGELLVADEEHNADLFWAIRGGSGNFGIVTSFEYRLARVGPTVLAGAMLHAADRAPAVLAAYRELMATAPDELGGSCAFFTAPPEPWVPEHLRDRLVLSTTVCWSGDVDDGHDAIAPLRALEPAADLVEPMPYVAFQAMFDATYPPRSRHYWTADFYGELPDELIDGLCEQLAVVPSPLTQVLVIPGLGAISRRPRKSTPYGQRTVPWTIHVLSIWRDPSDDPEQIAWTKAIAARLRPWTTGQVYLNYVGDEGIDRVRAAYGDGVWDRLVALKRRFDPDNVFRLNQNIDPKALP